MAGSWKFTSGIILSGALVLGAAWFFLRSSSAQQTAALPIHTVVFGDGARVDVLAIGIESLDYQEFPARESGWGKDNDGRSSYAHGHFNGGGFTTTEKEKNGVKSWSATQNGARPLLISIRLNDRVGRPVSVARSFSPIWMHYDMRLNERPGGGIGSDDWANFTGDEIAASLRKSGIDMHFQHHDPDTGWVPMSGPLWIGEEHPGDHVLALSVWRRDLRSLKFRVVREKGETVEFQLPAPRTPARDLRSIAAEPLPIIRTGSGYTVRLENIEIRQHGGSPPSIHAMAALESARYTTGRERDAHLEGSVIGVRDEAGNLDPFGLHFDSARRGLFQRQSPRLELLYEVRRNESYPVSAADCLMIAEGVVSADGMEVVFTLLPGAGRMGIMAIPAAPVLSAEDGFFHTVVGEHRLPVRVDGEIAEAALPRRFHGHEPSHLRLVVFQENANESSGISDFQSNGISSKSSHVRIGTAGGSRLDWKYHREDEWYAPSGELAPGKRIRLALAPPLREDLHIFPVEIPPDPFMD